MGYSLLLQFVCVNPAVPFPMALEWWGYFSQISLAKRLRTWKVPCLVLHQIDVGFCEQEPAEENIFGSYSCGKEERTLSCACSGVCYVSQWWDSSRCPFLHHHMASSSLKVKKFLLLCVVFGKLVCELPWLGKIWEPALQSCQVCGTAPDQSWLSIHETGLVVSWNWPSQQLMVTKLFAVLTGLSWTSYVHKDV